MNKTVFEKLTDVAFALYIARQNSLVLFIEKSLILVYHFYTF